MPRRTVCVLISLIGLCSVVPLVLLRFIDSEPQTESTIAEIRGLPRRKALDFEHGYTKDDLFDLNMQIKELENIKASVRNELRELDGKRWEIMKESTLQNELLNRLRKDVSTAKKELESVKNSVAKAKQEPTGVSTKASSTPPPIIILPQQSHKIADPPPLVKSSSPEAGRQSMQCTFETCFDFSVCPLIRKFTVHVYNTRQNINLIGTLPNPDNVTEWLAELEAQDLLAASSLSACLFIVIIGNVKDYKVVEARLKELEYWRGSGLNHLIIEHPSVIQSQLYRVDTGHAMVASAQHEHLKKNFDVFSAPVTTNAVGKFREHLPLLLSASKPKLLYFHGECQTGKNTDVLRTTVDGLLQLKEHIIDVDIKVSCNLVDKSYQSRDDECSMCDNQAERFTRLSQSKFALIPNMSGALMLVRIIEALRSTSVPVIIGTTYPLPFDTDIDWSLAVLRIPAGHFSQIHLILRSIEAFDVQQFCLQGRFLYENYFRSPVQIMSTIVASVRSRTMHPAPAILTTSFHTTKKKAQLSASSYIAMPSQQWRHNFTDNVNKLWNRPPGPFNSYPTTPFDPLPLSGSQYVSKTNAELKQLPPHVVLAGGITGPYFEDYLLGNIPNEQFTVVILTYQRNAVMVEAVERLSGLPHLYKVIVVWNNPEDIPSDMTLPNIDVPVEFVRAKKNSLNNRFIPYDAIETEAILSMDDDVYLRHDEIQFGFRVWREARERIVGFPGRFHAFDVRSRQWLYNSNYTCELSMVLTGAAFFHKYYAYLYTHWMPVEIRDMVDQYMNCEDIAMNFLVSHITRKPPVKVTSRWTFRCPGCPDTLSTDETHFHERHHCINYFVKVYGYMPLLYTQFRVDSVLFKTRLPTGLEKCFKYI